MIFGSGSRKHLLARLGALTLLLALPSAAISGVFYVDGSNPNCSNTGAGTADQPYCTISAAVSHVGGRGTTILVEPGVYREDVNANPQGSTDLPFILQADGPGVVIDGADDFGFPPLWAPVTGDVWLAGSVTWAPVQVFADGARLVAASDPPASIPPGSFDYVPGTGLFVNLGGGNPGAHQTFVGRRAHGIIVPGKPWVKIEGFHVTRTEEKGIVFYSGSSHGDVEHTLVDFCASEGIAVLGSDSVRVAGNHTSDNLQHGIALLLGSSGCIVQDNESFRNARPDFQSSTGIYLSGAPHNLIQRNRVHDNDDAGLEIQNGSDGCLSIQNLSWKNGDHGFEHLSVTGTTDIGNVAWGNRTDGFSIEGSASGTGLFDCIATDNGLEIREFDLYVDTSSTAGFTSDYNLFWNSVSTVDPIRYNAVRYHTLASFTAAIGQDVHSTEADPRFVDPGAGNFHLQADSPAIDAGTSAIAGWTETDADAHIRYDVASVPNTGAGPIPYADRGAFEFGATTLAVGDRGPGFELALSGAIPNPSTGAIAFLLDLPAAARVQWGIYDLAGRRVWGGERTCAMGRTMLGWRASLPGRMAGVYFAHFQIAGRSFARRFVLMR